MFNSYSHCYPMDQSISVTSKGCWEAFCIFILISTSLDLDLHCLPMSHKKDARHIWVNFSKFYKKIKTTTRDTPLLTLKAVLRLESIIVKHTLLTFSKLFASLCSCTFSFNLGININRMQTYDSSLQYWVGIFPMALVLLDSSTYARTLCS